jgi:hypothetical protein
MNTTFFDNSKLSVMFSGHLCLLLTEQVTWEQFPAYAEQVMKTIGASVRRKTDGIEMRIWSLEIVDSNCCLNLVWEDYPLAVSLESCSEIGDQFLRDIVTTQ